MDTESFFAWPAGAFVAVPGAGRVVAAGLAPVVLVEAASDARGAARVVDASAAGRVVRGRFAPVVVVGASDCLDAVFPGEDRVAAPGNAGVLRAADLRFSSPDVTDDRSGSASDAVAREDTPVLLAADPGAGRVGGLLRLDPSVLTRDVELGVGFDAVAVEARALLVVSAAGRRALAVALPLAAVGRRGGAGSLPAEAALDAILRRTDDVGVEGFGSFFRCGLAVWGVLVLEGAPASPLVGSIVYDEAGLRGSQINNISACDDLFAVRAGSRKDASNDMTLALAASPMHTRLLHALIVAGKPLPSRVHRKKTRSRLTANDNAYTILMSPPFIVTHVDSVLDASLTINTMLRRLLPSLPPRLASVSSFVRHVLAGRHIPNTA